MVKISPQQAVQVGRVTGPGLTDKWGLGGGDLGVMWASGETVFHVFGDNFKVVTQGGTDTHGPNGTDWRPNCIGRSSSINTASGIVFDNFNVDANGDRTAPIPLFSTSEDGLVPNAGIHVNGVDYMSYMVFPKGHTDFSQTRAMGTAQSTDGGKTWTRNYNCFWQNNATWTDKFQQSAFAWDGGPYVYRFMTPSARVGNIRLTRTPAASVADKSKYQYWTGSAWSSNMLDVGILIHGPAGEMSARYDDLLGVWMVLFHNDDKQAVMFSYAPTPTGPWSTPVQIINDSAAANQNLYAPEIHPMSSGTSLWFCGSSWPDYETYLYYANLNVTC